MLTRLRLRYRLNHGVAFAVTAALLAAGLPNFVVHAHADADRGHHAAAELPHEGGAASPVPSGDLHLHDFAVLGEVPTLPPAMLSGTVDVIETVIAENPARVVVNPSTSNPFRPPAA